jgi:hypothetical protein
MTAAGFFFIAAAAAGQVTGGPAAGQGAAEEPKTAVLQNAGKPMVVDFRCTNDDIQWAGLNCSEEEPCPVYLELTAVESVGNKIFAAGNIHSAASTLYSILLASDDAGKTWREPYQRVRGASLDHIQFVDFENGWISGQTVQPLPQDPFLLITSDGGKTWRQRPMFSEARSGAIVQFWFGSRINGSLVLDRGQSGEFGRWELYESPNGGETWMLRETNERQIRLKRSAGANTDWRIRADAASKAFHIERRQGERWGGLGAFLVRMPECKPAAEAAAAPAAEEKPAESAAPVEPVKRPAPTLRRKPG